jgi:hypothetical protein
MGRDNRGALEAEREASVQRPCQGRRLPSTFGARIGLLASGSRDSREDPEGSGGLGVVAGVMSVALTWEVVRAAAVAGW